MKPSKIPTANPNPSVTAACPDQAHGAGLPEAPAMPDARWRAGYAAAKAQAAALAGLYAHELFRMAVDDAMLDPARDGDLSPEGRARSEQLDVTMCQKAVAAHTAEDIEEAIGRMQPPGEDPPAPG